VSILANILDDLVGWKNNATWWQLKRGIDVLISGGKLERIKGRNDRLLGCPCAGRRN
jgi:hypothetical protein